MNNPLPFIISDTPIDTLKEIVSDVIARPDGIEMLAKLILETTYCDVNDAMRGIEIRNPSIKAVPMPLEIQQAWKEAEKLTCSPCG